MLQLSANRSLGDQTETRHSQPNTRVQVLSVSTSKEDGLYGEGEEVALSVVYSHPMDVLGTPTVPLNSGGEASFTLGGRTQVQPRPVWTNMRQCSSQSVLLKARLSLTFLDYSAVWAITD